MRARAQLPDGSVALVRAFSRDLAQAGGLLSPDYLESGLSLGEARILYELGHGEAGATISRLAATLGLDLGYVSRVATRLAGQGLLARGRKDGDRRARPLALTRAGRTRLGALGRRADRRLGAWLAEKSAPGVDRLVAGLQAFFDPADAEVVLRDARPGDIGRIITRHAEIYSTEFGYPEVFERYVTVAFGKLCDGFAAPRDRILVAERGGVMLGTVSVKGQPGRRAQLRFLFVERAARGLGLGRRLVQAVIDGARATNERQIFLETASDLPAARGLYAAAGFRLTKSVRGVEFLPKGVASETWTLDLD